jgi:hypothetical protein
LEKNIESPTTSLKKPFPTSNGETEPDSSLWSKEDKENLKIYGLKLIHENCDLSVKQSKNLPQNALIVSYNVEDKLYHDIVQSYAKVKVFDAYYDRFGKDSILSINLTNGRISPRLYGGTKPDSSKKRNQG